MLTTLANATTTFSLAAVSDPAVRVLSVLFLAIGSDVAPILTPIASRLPAIMSKIPTIFTSVPTILTQVLPVVTQRGPILMTLVLCVLAQRLHLLGKRFGLVLIARFQRLTTLHLQCGELLLKGLSILLQGGDVAGQLLLVGMYLTLILSNLVTILVHASRILLPRVVFRPAGHTPPHAEREPNEHTHALPCAPHHPSRVNAPPRHDEHDEEV